MTLLRTRSSLITIYSKSVGLILIVFGSFYFFYFNSPHIAVVSIICGIFAFATTSLIAKTSEILAILFLYLCGLSVVLYASSKTGGILSPIVFWVTTTPMLVGLVFRSSRYILASGLFSFVIAISCIFLDQEIVFSKDYLRVASLMALLGICTLNVLMTFVFHAELSKEKALVEEQMEQLKTLEAEMVQKEKMATIGLLASGVAHQLGNTLNTISTATIDMDRRIKRNKLTPEILSSFIASIESATNLSVDIIRGLDYATKRNIAKELIDLKEVIDVAIILMKGSILEKVNTKNDVVINTKVFASKSGLIQVFMNLISNSIDAMESGDIIISSIANNTFVDVTYKDTGPGISKEIVPKIFDAFFTTKTADQGTGLGLYIVRQELEKMGANISLIEQEKGAAFLIKIPIGVNQ